MEAFLMSLLRLLFAGPIEHGGLSKAARLVQWPQAPGSVDGVSDFCGSAISYGWIPMAMAPAAALPASPVVCKQCGRYSGENVNLRVLGSGFK